MVAKTRVKLCQSVCVVGVRPTDIQMDVDTKTWQSKGVEIKTTQPNFLTKTSCALSIKILSFLFVVCV